MAGSLDRVRIAVVEDDPEYRESILLPVLSRSGFVVVGMGSALDLYRAMLAQPFDLVLLDIELPDDSGFSIASHLRSLSPSIGIVMLTGRRASADRRRGLDAGADAYLAKPVDMGELVATLRNLSKRIAAQPAGAGDAPGAAAPPAAQGGWRLNRQGWHVLAPGGGEMALTLAERQVMVLLARTPGVPVSREALIARLAGDVHDFDPHRLEMLVYRLRRKCRMQCGTELPIRAVRGVGYVLAW